MNERLARSLSRHPKVIEVMDRNPALLPALERLCATMDEAERDLSPEDYRKVLYDLLAQLGEWTTHSADNN